MSTLGGGLKTIDWGAQKIERSEKNFYAEDKRVSSRTDKEVEDFRRSQQIKVTVVPQSRTDRPY